MKNFATPIDHLGKSLQTVQHPTTDTITSLADRNTNFATLKINFKKFPANRYRF